MVREVSGLGVGDWIARSILSSVDICHVPGTDGLPLRSVQWIRMAATWTLDKRAKKKAIFFARVGRGLVCLVRHERLVS